MTMNIKINIHANDPKNFRKALLLFIYVGASAESGRPSQTARG